MTLLFGRYEYVRELGVGATGRVLLVRDRASGTERAIKVVSAQHAALLQWEFSRLRMVQHPYLSRVHELLTLDMPVHELGLLPKSLLLVEDYVEGVRWGSHVRSLADDPTRRERALVRAAHCVIQALCAVHDAGLVHGDVKPDNVLVWPSGDAATLVDFGFARAPGLGVPPRGTPRNMAPELHAGVLTQAADVYALGASLYDLSGGEGVSAGPVRAFPALPTASAAFNELLRVLTHEDPAERPGDAREALSALLVAARALGVELVAGDGYALARPARAPEVMSRRALTMPFVPWGDALLRLVQAIESQDLTVLRGPRHTGRTRLAREAMRVFNERCVAADVPPFTSLEGLEGLSAFEAARVLVLLDDARAEQLPEVRRALQAARLAGRTMHALVVLEADAQVDEAAVITLPPMGDAELATLARKLLDREVLEPGLEAALIRASDGYAGRVCHLVSRAFARGISPDDPALAHSFADVFDAASLPVEAQRLLLAAAWCPRILSMPALAAPLFASHADAQGAFEALGARGVLSVTSGQLAVSPGVARDVRAHSVQQARGVLGPWVRSLPPSQAFELYLADQADASAQAFVAESRALRRAGHAHEARELLREAVQLLPRPALWLELAECERSLASYPAALALVEGLDTAEAAVARAELLRLVGDASGAERALSQVRGATAMEARAGALLARLAYDRGDLSEAAELCSRVERERDAEADLRVGEVRVLLALARGEGALPVSELLVSAARAHADARFVGRALALRSLAHTAQGERVKALADAREAVMHARAAGEAHDTATFSLNRGLLEFEAGALGPALDALDEAAHRLCIIDRRRDLVRVLFNLGNVALFVGDHARAEVVLRAALERLSAHSDITALTYLRVAFAELCLTRGAVDEALTILRSTLAELPADRPLLLVLVLARQALTLLAHEAIADAARAVVEAERIDVADDVVSGVELSIAQVRVSQAQGAFAQAEAQARVALGRYGERAPAPERLRLWMAASDAARLAGNEAEAAQRSQVARAHLEQMLLGLSPRQRAQMRALPAHARVLSGSARVRAEPPPSGERFRALLHGARRLFDEGTRPRLCQRAAELLLELVHAERALVIEAREPRGRLTVLGGADLAGSAARERRVLPGASDRPASEAPAFSRSVVERALYDQATVVTMEAQHDVRFDAAESLASLSVRSLLCVPLRGVEPPAVLYLDDRMRGAAFGSEDLALAEDLSLLLAQALRVLGQRRREERRARRAEEERAQLASELEAAQSKVAHESPLVFSSVQMGRVVELCRRVGKSDVPVLIAGESGTGKELLARYVHASSERRSGPFVAESCAALPDTLLESALFGHVRGAFTGADRNKKGLFELAEGGTLLLDEVGEMSAALQAKLLRVLQEGEVRPLGSERTRRVNVRVIAATHRDLQKLVQAQAFREDLYYRLAVVSIEVPPLRARREDIAALVSHFVEKHGAGRRITVRPEVLSALESGAWPGNVRELENRVRRALALCEQHIELSHVGVEAPPSALASDELDLHARTELLTRSLVEEALSRSGGNLTQAAELLGISRFGLQKMVKRLSLGPYGVRQRK